MFVGCKCRTTGLLPISVFPGIIVNDFYVGTEPVVVFSQDNGQRIGPSFGIGEARATKREFSVLGRIGMPLSNHANQGRSHKRPDVVWAGCYSRPMNTRACQFENARGKALKVATPAFFFEGIFMDRCRRLQFPLAGACGKQRHAFPQSSSSHVRPKCGLHRRSMTERAYCSALGPSKAWSLVNSASAAKPDQFLGRYSSGSPGSM